MAAGAISSSSSSTEIEMYGLGEKVIRLISAEMVEVAVIRQLAIQRTQHTPEAPSV